MNQRIGFSRPPTKPTFLEALQEYILGVGQEDAGGLRDKPGKRADVYHTFYALCGLSTAQHRVYRSKITADKLRSQWKDSPAFRPSTGKSKPEDEATMQARRREIWVQSRSWREDETSHRYVGSPNNRVVGVCALAQRNRLIITRMPRTRYSHFWSVNATQF